nr:hypothetical protein [Halocatena marina]
MFAHVIDADAVFGSFVFHHLGESVERQPVQIEVAVVASISTITETNQVAHGDRPSISGGTSATTSFETAWKKWWQRSRRFRSSR